MKHISLPREPTELQTLSPRTKPFQERLRFDFVIVICLFVQHVSSTYNQMMENTQSSKLNLKAGILNYLSGLKRDESTAPGVFAYSELGASSTTNKQKLRFFDSEPVAGFVHAYEIEIDLSGRIFQAVYVPQLRAIVF